MPNEKKLNTKELHAQNERTLLEVSARLARVKRALKLIHNQDAVMKIRHELDVINTKPKLRKRLK